jgi:formate dehydrogenase (NADP+) beta subunit
VPWAAADKALKSIKVEVELGFDAAAAFKEAQRCLNCDVQTVFARASASSATPASTSARWTASPSPMNGEEADLRTRLQGAGENLAQDAVRVGRLRKTGA